jgi:transposase InsO family protein
VSLKVEAQDARDVDRPDGKLGRHVGFLRARVRQIPVSKLFALDLGWHKTSRRFRRTSIERM